MSHYNNAPFPEGIQPNANNVYRVGWESLPLTCPMPEMSLWNSHPQVYISLTESRKSSCIYCGVTYILKDPVPGEPIPDFADNRLEEAYLLRLNQVRRGTA